MTAVNSEGVDYSQVGYITFAQHGEAQHAHTA
jgi:hypothetical protein